jgi:hypothetical protein
MIITDNRMPQQLRDQIEELGIDLVIADEQN